MIATFTVFASPVFLFSTISIFALFEMITGRKVPPKYEGIVHLVGVVFFLLLMIVIMYHDIMRLFS